MHLDYNCTFSSKGICFSKFCNTHLNDYDFEKVTLRPMSHTTFLRNCDKNIKRHFDKNIFILQNIVVTFQNLFKLHLSFSIQTLVSIDRNKYFYSLFKQEEKYLMKNVFLSQYCVQKCLV